MAASAPPDGGLVITRINSQQWQFRLIAGTAVRQFSGTVESSEPLTLVNGVKLESPDSAQQAARELHVLGAREPAVGARLL